MAQEKKEQEALNVVDRRRFTSEGERRPDAPAETPPQPLPPPPPPQPAAAAPESEPARAARQAYERQGPPQQYNMDLETLVMSLSTSAMYQLGLVEDPVRGRIPADFEGARHTIDMLGVIQEKTRGNLTPAEQKLLEQVLYELRVAFVTLTGGPAPKLRGPGPGGKAGTPKS